MKQAVYPGILWCDSRTDGGQKDSSSSGVPPPTQSTTITHAHANLLFHWTATASGDEPRFSSPSAPYALHPAHGLAPPTTPTRGMNGNDILHTLLSTLKLRPEANVYLYHIRTAWLSSYRIYSECVTAVYRSCIQLSLSLAPALSVTSKLSWTWCERQGAAIDRKFFGSSLFETQEGKQQQ